MELLDIDSNNKMNARVLTCVKVNNDRYVFYCINRDNVEDNVFVSKLSLNSEGYYLSNDFVNGEKESLDSIFSMLINNDLNKNIDIIRNINFSLYNKFSSSACYVGSCNSNIINDVISNFGDISYDKVVLEKPKDKDKINYNNLFLVIFGIAVLVFCVLVIFNVFFHK